MSLRCFLFRLAMERAHRAMNLGSLFPVSRLPQCYDATAGDFELGKARKREFALVGRDEYTLWSLEGDHESCSYWKSWSAKTVNDFIRKYQHRYLHETITLHDGSKIGPLYPEIVTGVLFGSYIKVVLEGRKEEYKDKFSQVHRAISNLLENYLHSSTHRLLCILLRLVNRAAATGGRHVPSQETPVN